MTIKNFSIFIVVLFAIAPYCLHSQVKVAADADLVTPADPSAALEVLSTNKGFLPPRMTTAQRDAITSPANGLFIFNTTENCINEYAGTSWITHCELRYSNVCNCVEYLNDYGLPTEAWISIDAPPMDDHDWYEVGTTVAPDAITDNIYTEGKVTVNSQTNSNGQFNVYGDNTQTSAAGYFQLAGTGNSAQTTLDLSLITQSGFEKKGITNYIQGSASGNVYGTHQILNYTGTGLKYALYNNFGTSGGTQYGVTNEFLSSVNTSKIGIWNRFNLATSGTNYGMLNNFDAASTSVKYGVFSSFPSAAAGTKYGIRNNFSTSTASGTIYGMYNTIYNDGPSTKYGVYNLFSGIADGYVYGVRNNISMNSTNPDNAYGIYNTITASGTGTAYGGYFSTTGTGNYGIYATNTNNGSRAGAFRGDVEIGDGWLVVGDGNVFGNTAEYNSVTRYAVWEGSFTMNISFDADGYRYYNIGNVNLPGNVPATVTATKIIWEMDGYHEDANEDHGVWIALQGTTYTGGGGWYGWFGNASNGAKDVNWHYVSNGISLPMASNQNLRMRVQDEDCTFCGGDDMRVFNFHIKIYYQYTEPLEEGEIAASGRIFSNTNNQVGDLAEHFEVKTNEGIEYGQIVVLKPGTDNEYDLAAEPYSQHIVGVISENPSVVLNNPSVGPPVALAGRVKVKIADNNGEGLIKSGDFLTTSSIPGKAMLATEPGPVIGYAVANQKPGTDYVEILVQPGRFYYPRQKEKPTGRRMD